jgi:hypothetical protein
MRAGLSLQQEKESDSTHVETETPLGLGARYSGALDWGKSVREIANGFWAKCRLPSRVSEMAASW